MKVLVITNKYEESVRMDIVLNNDEKTIHKFIDFNEDSDVQTKASIAILKVLFGSLNVTVKNK